MPDKFTLREERNAFSDWLVKTGRSKRSGNVGIGDWFKTGPHEFYNEWIRANRPLAEGGLLVEARAGVDPIKESILDIETQRAISLFGQPPIMQTPEALVSWMQGLTGEDVAKKQAVIEEARVVAGGEPKTEEEAEAAGVNEYWDEQGYLWRASTDPITGEKQYQRVDFDPTRRAVPPQAGVTDWQRAQQEQQQQQFETTQQRFMEEAEATRLFREQQMGFSREQLAVTQAWQEQQIGVQREQEAARLAAQPISWLQHAKFTGQQPVVQKWMEPLARPGQNLQAGQTLPGWVGTQGAGQSMTGLPQLTIPSAQLFSRMGPTAQQQWAGFRQARTGIPPEETLFRQRQSGPPGGRQALQWARPRV